MTALALPEEGQGLASQGKIEEALAAYQKATQMDKTQISAASWGALCWHGSSWEQADKVMDACENAVSLAPKEGSIVDSRGLARALTGDFKGAIEDFEFSVQWSEQRGDATKAKMRKNWIAELQAGRNPFTKEVLEGLR